MVYADQFKPADRDIYTSLEKVRGAGYDKKAAFYECLVSTRLFNRVAWNTSPDDYKAFAAGAILTERGRLIDIGCGGLAQTAALYRASPNDCLLADRSVEMLKIARRRLSENGTIPGNVTLLQTDAFHLPFPDNSFDTVCSFGTIHLFNNKQAFVNAALRVLKPGGSFYFLSMTTRLLFSRLFMAQLRVFGEFGTLCSPDETMALFNSSALEVNSYVKGSVVFISGRKISS